MKNRCKLLAVTLGLSALLAGCGPTAEEQHGMDMQRCGGFGFTPGTESFAHCMMGVTQEREAQAAADRRAAADRDAADKRASDAARAAKDRADQAAWDRRIHGDSPSSSVSSAGAPSSSSIFGPSPVDQISDQIDRDRRKIEGSE